MTDGRRIPLPADAADAAPPICAHYGACGGCVAQHLGDAVYAEWKRGVVVEAFRRHGLAPDIAPLLRIAPGTRRRAVLSVAYAGGAAMIGYHAARSHDVIAIRECPVLRPSLVAALPQLHAIVDVLGTRATRMTLLDCANGIDVAVETADGRGAGAAGVARLGKLVSPGGLLRISVDGEVAAELAKPQLTLGGVAVVPPPGIFVQAAAEAETAMTGLVLAGVAKARHVTELFCGIGTLTFALARKAQVTAFDESSEAVAALAAAARHARGLKPITPAVRDLYRDPLTTRELATADAIVLDPPRAGAKAQVKPLAGAKARTIVYVSCHPETLARDTRVLVDGGYRITRVTPVDQFLYSAHVEAVAILERAGR